MRFWLTLSLAFLCCASSAPAQRAIPDDNLGYPVLINLSECRNGATAVKGSGFYLHSGSFFYLVTARHVIYNEMERNASPSAAMPQCAKAELVSYSKNPNNTEANVLRANLQQLHSDGRVKAHPLRDVALVALGEIHVTQGTQTFSLYRGGEIVHTNADGVVGVVPEQIKTFDQVLTANDAFVLGYPSSIGIPALPQIDYSAPLLRKGVIAGVNRATKTVIIDCLTFHGNSGGPVMQVVQTSVGSFRFDVIGIVSQYVPVSETWWNTTVQYANVQIYNSGYTVVEPMDSVLELINGGAR